MREEMWFSNGGDQMAHIAPNDGHLAATARLEKFNFYFQAAYHEVMNELPPMALKYNDAVQWMIEEEIEVTYLMQCVGHNQRLSPYREIYDMSKAYLKLGNFLELIDIALPVVYGDGCLVVKVEGPFLSVYKNTIRK